MNVTTIGLDIAKNVFHLVGADAHGKQVLKKRLTRGKVVAYFANLSACLVGIEACGGAQYWARQLIALGHEARLIHPKFVKPYADLHAPMLEAFASYVADCRGGAYPAPEHGYPMSEKELAALREWAGAR